MTTSNLSLLFWLLALVLFLVDAWLVPSPARPKLQSVGLACVVIAILLHL
jgi:hypothetical protein